MDPSNSQESKISHNNGLPKEVLMPSEKRMGGRKGEGRGSRQRGNWDRYVKRKANFSENTISCCASPLQPIAGTGQVGLQQ